MTLHERLKKHLEDEATKSNGWLSDLQPVGVDDYGIWSSESGYIDIDHLVSEVLMFLGKEED